MEHNNVKHIFDTYKYIPTQFPIIKKDYTSSVDIQTTKDIQTIEEKKIININKPIVKHNNIDLELNLLSAKQKIAYDKFVDGQNIFITGPGGTGKSKLIQYFVNYYKYMNPKFLQVCAMTGCATILLNCNARTIHSWSGIKLAKGTSDQIIFNVINNRNALKNWKSVKVLIIDEISMMSKKIFEILDKIAKTVKHSQLPFGGIQVVFCGDFCQLPPVGTPDDKDTYDFCFNSPLWNTIFPYNNCIELTHIFRQTDPVYTKILHNIRKGIITKSSNTILSNCINKKVDNEKYNGCIPTKIFPIRSKVDFINKQMFNKLSGDIYTFNTIECTNNTAYIDTYNNFIIGDRVKIKCDEQYYYAVIIDKNINNYSVKYLNHNIKYEYNVDHNRIFCENVKMISNDDLIKGHRMTKEDVTNEINNLLINSPCVYNLQLKVGASVMCIVNLDMDNGICNGSQGIVIDFINTNTNPIPVVKFANGITKNILPYNWSSENYPNISISQIPLCLSWAITIHKVQGATLDMAEIDIGNNIFEYGQTYVALSRVKSIDGLFLSAYDPSKISVNPEVIEFYNNIN